jgi:hypothetical protein
MQQQILPGQMPAAAVVSCLRIIALIMTLIWTMIMSIVIQITRTIIMTMTMMPILTLLPSQQFGSPYASVPLAYSPYLPGLVSPLLAGQDPVLQQSPPPLQQLPGQQQLQPGQQQKQRSDRIEVSPTSHIVPLLQTTGQLQIVKRY